MLGSLALFKTAPETDAGITVGGVKFKDADALIEHLRRLAGRLSNYQHHAETQLMGEAWPYVMQRQPRDGLDVIVAQMCYRFHRIAMQNAPKQLAPTPMDSRIAELQPELEAVSEKLREVQGRAAELQHEILRAAYRNEDAQGLREQLAAARRQERRWDEEWMHIRAQIQALEMSASRWRVENEVHTIGIEV